MCPETRTETHARGDYIGSDATCEKLWGAVVEWLGYRNVDLNNQDLNAEYVKDMCHMC